MLKALSSIVCIILFCVFPISAQSEIPQLPDSREAFIFDPIFKGDVYLHEAGRHHAISVVLVHGVGDRGATIWDPLIQGLSKNYHTVTFDLPGFGRSSKKNVLYSPTSYAAFIKYVVDRCVRDSFILVGHYLGGAIALRFAATYPKDLRQKGYRPLQQFERCYFYRNLQTY